MRLLVALAVLPMLLLTACGSLTGPGGADVDGRSYLSTSVTDNGAPRELVDGTRVGLSFRDGTVTASAGCNTMAGSYRIVDQTLVVDNLGMTEMGCPGDLAAQDTWLSGLLTSEPAIALEEDTLTLTSGSSVLTMLDRVIADPDRPLVGTVWRVDSLISGDAVSSTPAGARATLTFASDGTLSVSPGCNTGGGSWTLDGDTLTMDRILTTRMACDDARGELEAAVLGVLGAGELTVDITAASLTLSAGDTGLGLRAEE